MSRHIDRKRKKLAAKTIEGLGMFEESIESYKQVSKDFRVILPKLTGGQEIELARNELEELLDDMDSKIENKDIMIDGISTKSSYGDLQVGLEYIASVEESCEAVMEFLSLNDKLLGIK